MQSLYNSFRCFLDLTFALMFPCCLPLSIFTFKSPLCPCQALALLLPASGVLLLPTDHLSLFWFGVTAL